MISLMLLSWLFIVPINISGASSLPYIFTYSFAMPYFFIGLVVLFTAIAGIGTRKADITCLVGLITSLLFTFINYALTASTNSFLDLALGAFAVLWLIALLAGMHRKDDDGGQEKHKPIPPNYWESMPTKY